ncbi:sensor histidine kinase [Cupriavidus plantarum]|nr:ATP-binding protein [Cupriavidus plantarum]
MPASHDDRLTADRLARRIASRIADGDHLGRVHAEARLAIEASRRANDIATEMVVGSQLRLVRRLRHDAPAREAGPPVLSPRADFGFDESLRPALQEALFFQHLYAALSAFFEDETSLALEQVRAAENRSEVAPHHSMPCLLFLGAMTRLRAARALTASEDFGERMEDEIEKRRTHLDSWAKAHPRVASKALLVSGELARVRGNDALASELYARSASAAHAGGQLMVHAMASEFAAIHRHSRAGTESALDHFRQARYLYGFWGAHAKARRLNVADRPQADAGENSNHMRHWGNGVEMDLQTGMKAIQAMSGEIVLEKLVDIVLETMMTHAYAQYGVLLLIRGGKPIVEAVGRTSYGRVLVEAVGIAPTEERLPLAALNRALVCRRLMAFDGSDEALSNGGSALNGRAIHAALCVPLMRHGAMVGLLYLEDRCGTGQLSRERLAILDMLGQHAANSIVTALLYRELVDENERRAETEAALVKARADLARTSHLTVMGGMAASITHEINQPLAAIVNCGGAGRRWLARDVPDIAEAMAAFDQISSAAVRTSEIIHALRALAKQAPASLMPLGIDGVITSVLDLMRVEIEDRGVRMTLSLGTAGKTVVGNRVQLQQVVLNLITNALEAMADTPHDSRELAISSGMVEGQITVAVTDRGSGIDPASLAGIFEPFVTTKHTGMGMGLAICHSILEAHGGTIHATSVPGKGSTFCFRIPRAT